MQLLFDKIKLWIKRIFIFSLIFSVIFLLFKANFIYLKADNMSITIGIPIKKVIKKEDIISEDVNSSLILEHIK